MVPMQDDVPVANRTMELSDCRDKWSFSETYDCWCLKDILYTEKADVPAFQRLSVFVPRAYMHPDGTPTEESRKVPIVFENNSAGYMQMPHTWLGGPRCYAEPYLKDGLIYVTCGCRGRESRNAEGKPVGKAPVSLVDLKTAIRFLRHNRAALPGNFDRVISVGWSAGGAMSTLLGVTGDNSRYNSYLEAAGAYMDESDAVFASQIYCPIIDLEHADMAYEWCFGADKTCEDSHAGRAETMTPFKEALSRELASRYVTYVNSLCLKHPVTGEALTLHPGGRSGAFYDYLMACISHVATEYLTRLDAGSLPENGSAEDYVKGCCTYKVAAPAPGPAHQAGPGGVPSSEMKPAMAERQGTDKRSWLAWDGKKAAVTDLDAYVLHHRRRMKPCTSFDKLENDSAENQLFGSPQHDFMHFNAEIGRVVKTLQDAFPAEAEKYADAFDVSGDAELAERIYLTNPMNFIAADEQSRQARYYRIRVGACDADTSLSIAMTLAVRLQNAGFPVDYALVWDQPHCEADYPGQVLSWIHAICAEA